MSVSEAVRDFVDDTVESTELATRKGFHPEPRCRVCRNNQVRKKVNDMLASGASYAMVLRTLVDDGTEVSVETGLRAAEKLQSVLDGRERGTDVLELKVQLGRIGEAVRAVVPQQMWAAIVEKLEELEQHSGALGAPPRQ